MATTNVDLTRIGSVNYNHNGATTDIDEVWYCCTNNATCDLIWKKRNCVASSIYVFKSTTCSSTFCVNKCYSWPEDQEQFTTHVCGSLACTSTCFSIDTTYTRGQNCRADIALTTEVPSCTLLCVRFSLCCGCPPGKVVIRSAGNLVYEPVYLQNKVANSYYNISCYPVDVSPKCYVDDLVVELTEPGTVCCICLGVLEAGEHHFQSEPIEITPASAVDSNLIIYEYCAVPQLTHYNSSLAVDVYNIFGDLAASGTLYLGGTSCLRLNYRG